MTFLFNVKELNALEKLKKARIQIQQKNTFFGILALYLKFHEDKKTKTCGIDETGNLYYNPDWIKKLSDDKVQGLMVHELMHNAVLHLSRRRNRYPDPWNFAADICVNIIALRNGYSLPDGGIIPTHNSYDDKDWTLRIGKKTLNNLGEKTAEQIYEELPLTAGKNQNDMIILGRGTDEKGFDQHIEGAPKSEKEKKAIEDMWLERVSDAANKSILKGDVPLGLQSLIKDLHKSQIPWRALLLRFIQAHIPYDYSFQRCSKKSIASGYYMPNYLKERIKVLVGVDLSGSIGQKEMDDFMSEVIGLAKAYQDRVQMILLTHDVDVHSEYILENGVSEKVKKLKLRGGGGTSHRPILNKIKEKYRDTKIAIFFSDMYSDLEYINLDEYPFGKMFVISKGGNRNPTMKGRCHLIKLE